MFKYSIKTLGCKANVYDSLVIEKELTELGGLRDDESPDLFILNSCTVTNGADVQAKREINAVKKKKHDAYAMVTGCYAQVAKEKVKETTGVDAVVTNEEKSSLKKIVAEKFGIENATEASHEDIYWGQLPVFQGKTRAFLKIQDGCNDFCTYCIIPYARGKSRSVKLGDVLGEITRLVANGVKEVVLTGINIADYGTEFGITLEVLIENILEHTTLPRLRLTSLDPSEISDRLIDLVANEPRVMPHFHVSLQSANSRVLRAMKRSYREEEVVSVLEKIHAKSDQIFVGMDVITGFPSETLDEHKATVELLKRLPWTRLHVFPYSEREGTPALKLKPAVPGAERKRRAQELMHLSHQRYESFAKRFVGATLDEILFETPHEVAGDFYVIGHTRNYLRVMGRAPTRTKEEAYSYLNQLGKARVVGMSPKPEQDWTLEATFQ